MGSDRPSIKEAGKPSPIKYYDGNANGAWDDGEDIVLDGNGNGVFD